MDKLKTWINKFLPTLFLLVSFSEFCIYLNANMENSRKWKDFILYSFQGHIESRWNANHGRVTAYAWWATLWENVQAGKEAETYKELNADTSLLNEFDYIGVVLGEGYTLIEKWARDSSETAPISLKKYLFHKKSYNKGDFNTISEINGKYYMMTVSALCDFSGSPMIPGVMIFAYDLKRYLNHIERLLPVKLEITKNGRAGSFIIPLKDYQISGDDPLFIKAEHIYNPLSINAFAFGFLSFQVLISIFVFIYFGNTFTLLKERFKKKS
ncbi:MAG TPA: hypothetical protein PKK94_18195 [Leptospiraceae bacterium]|nr:hypothetical protein [Leptospiraceae bacterium]HNO24913.1 hypothetical protein [Leptospiraceae bacterium]